MVYLLKMVIFHGYVSHNQMVYSLKSHYYPLIIIIDIIIPFVSIILPIFSRHSRNTTIDTFGIWWKSMKPVAGTPTRKILPPSNFSSAWPGLKPRNAWKSWGKQSGAIHCFMAVDRWENHLPSGNWLQSANLKMVIYVVVLPIFYMVIFHGYVNVYQRVSDGGWIFYCHLWFPEGIQHPIDTDDFLHHIFRQTDRVLFFSAAQIRIQYKKKDFFMQRYCHTNPLYKDTDTHEHTIVLYILYSSWSR